MHGHSLASERDRPHERPRRAGAALLTLFVVIALHLGLYTVLRGSAGWKERRAERPAAPMVSLRLLPWRELPLPERPHESRAGTPQARPERNAPAAISAPATPPTPTASPRSEFADAATPAAPPASQPPRPLDLTLPRGFATRPEARNPAVDDARSTSARTTPEQRMARSFDTQLVEESFGDGRRRFRRGDDCAIVSPSRIAQLMPFNEAAARTPSMVSACP